MDNLFTPSAKSVLALAQEQAKYFKHQAVGTEHLLLALTIEKKRDCQQGVTAVLNHRRRCARRN